MKAQELMTAHELWACVDESDSREAARMMADHNVGAIPVLDQDGCVEGIVTDRDICCRLVAEGRGLETPVREIMTGSVQSVLPDADLSEIESVMRRYKIRRLPVVDRDNKLQGFISISDLVHVCCGQKEEHELVEVIDEITSYE